MVIPCHMYHMSLLTFVYKMPMIQAYMGIQNHRVLESAGPLKESSLILHMCTVLLTVNGKRTYKGVQFSHNFFDLGVFFISS